MQFCIQSRSSAVAAKGHFVSQQDERFICKYSRRVLQLHNTVQPPKHASKRNHQQHTCESQRVNPICKRNSICGKGGFYAVTIRKSVRYRRDFVVGRETHIRHPHTKLTKALEHQHDCMSSSQCRRILLFVVVVNRRRCRGRRFLYLPTTHNSVRCWCLAKKDIL